METENVTEITDTDHVDPTHIRWVCPLMTAEGVAGVLGNLLVCFVIVRVKILHNMTNYLMAHLAVADMISCMQCIVFYLLALPSCALIDYVPASGWRRELFCRLLESRFASWACSNLACLSLCIVTWERYVAIVQPLRYTAKVTPVKVALCILLTWALSVLLPVPFLFRSRASEESGEICRPVINSDKVLAISTAVFTFLMAYLLPVGLMVWAYFKIQVTLKRQAQALTRQYARAAANDLLIAGQRLASMLTVVLGALILLLTPAYIVAIICLYSAGPHEHLPALCGSTEYQILREIGNFFFYFNSVVNPLIYEFKYKRFQEGLKMAFSCRSTAQGGNRIGIQVIPM